MILLALLQRAVLYTQRVRIEGVSAARVKLTVAVVARETVGDCNEKGLMKGLCNDAREDTYDVTE